jgi:hypothetical protein
VCSSQASLLGRFSSCIGESNKKEGVLIKTDKEGILKKTFVLISSSILRLLAFPKTVVKFCCWGYRLALRLLSLGSLRGKRATVLFKKI